MGAYAQSSPASSSATPTQKASSQPSASGAAASQTENLAEVVDYLIPTASITSLSPAQSTKLASDISVYFSQYTASNPISALEQSIVVNQGIGGLLGGATTPSPAQISSIEGLVNNAENGLVGNPSAFISSANALISPFPFATIVQNYESGFVDGLRTVVASDMSLSVPPPASATSSHSTGGAAPARPTGVIAGGIAVAAGLVGAALL
ncbi:MAG: hypothetical protein LQ340_005387 [Diploschistes diacapsis]|nr:MAG: hypothetical protein LQ340_005387 [Diploschistes diacapsis]